MSYVGYGQSPYVPEPKVRFDAIGEAWALVREKMGVWIPATLIVGGVGMLATFLISGGLGFAFGLTSGNDPNVAMNPVYWVVNIVSNLVAAVINAFIISSLFRMAIKQVRGENIELSDAFQFGDNIGAVILTTILYNIAVTIGILLCIIPGFIAVGGLMLAIPLSVDRGVSGPQALSMSWDKLKGQVLNAILLLLAVGVITTLSMIPCGLGLLVTVPLSILTSAIVYRDIFDGEGGMRGPQLDIPLPPSTAYGATSPQPGMTPPAPYGQNPGEMPGRGNTMPGTPPPP
ncbi:MAG: hypothetical protein H8F28_20885, partial [Fibrella sp.]|nr:hypothetical protein [Armatimonadota bacterium]